MLDTIPTYIDNANLLRFITCGSVDDGKSTLIGRMLFETGQIPEDHLKTLKKRQLTINTDKALREF